MFTENNFNARINFIKNIRKPSTLYPDLFISRYLMQLYCIYLYRKTRCHFLLCTAWLLNKNISKMCVIFQLLIDCIVTILYIRWIIYSLTHGHLMTRNCQQPTCESAICGNQSLTIKHCLQECPQWRDSRVKCNIQGDIRTLFGKDCEVQQMMKFLKEIGKFEEI